MRHAAVYGARQPFGFELCSQLLERGYCVNAVDHEYWMRESDEEKWLFIGRNANLHYFELQNGDDHGNLPFQPQNDCLFFIPVIDYADRPVPEVSNQLIRQIEAIPRTDEWNANYLVLIHPPASKRDQGPFFKKINAIFNKWKADNFPVMEYGVPENISRNRKNGCKQAENDPLQEGEGFWHEVIKYILDDVEEKVRGFKQLK